VFILHRPAIADTIDMEEEMAKSDAPPVPPAGRTNKGRTEPPAADARAPETDARKRDLSKQGRQGNISQNTTNQGYQQDR
jgi:hypothetical protein